MMGVSTEQLRRWMAIPYEDGGRGIDGADCWGLHRLIVAEVTGRWLGEWSGQTDALEIARTMKGQQAEGGWREVPAGDERLCDLVLMTGVAGSGGAARVVPMHVGTVIHEPWMLDVEIGRSPMLRAYRAGAGVPVHPRMGRRLLGVYRPAALEDWTP